jgi:capsule polysaccharide export protein KpsE/RkpR
MTPDNISPVIAADPPDDEISLLDLLQLVADNLRLLVLAPVAAGVVALGITYIIPPTFTAKVQFIPPKQQQSSAAAALSDLGILGGAAGAIAGVKNPADQYAALAKSSSVADALTAQFKLDERYDEQFKEKIRKELASNTRITVGAKDGLISIEVDDTDAQIAADMANAYVTELRKLLNRVALTEAQQRRMFFERMVGQAKTNMVQAEQALKASGVDGAALKISASSSLEGVARLKAQISVQEVKLAAMRGYLADTAPDFKQAVTELSALRSQMAQADQGDAAPTGQSDYVARFREFKYQETLFALYMRQFEVARLDESREGAVIQVVDVAEKPERKSKPKRGLIATLTTLATGFALLLFIFVRQSVRNSAQSPETAEKMQRLRGAWFRALGRS